jgi:hypothetical protein
VRRYAYGIAIEGVGLDPTKTAGLCFYYGQRLAQPILDGSDYQWIGGFQTGQGLAELPQSAGFSADPFLARARGSSFVFDLHYPESVAQRALLGISTAESHTLAASIDIADTVVTIDGLSGAGNNGIVVWVNDEAIRLDSNTGANYNVTRGLYGTQIDYHRAGDLVFLANPYVVNRRLRVIQINRETGEEIQRWSGVVDDMPTPDGGVRLSISARELLAQVTEAVVNRGATDLQGAGGASIFVRPERVVAAGSINHTEIRSRGGKPNETARWNWYQMQNALWYAIYQRNPTNGFAGAVFANVEAHDQSGRDIDRDDLFLGLKSQGPIHELFVVDRGLDELDDELITATPQDRYSATRWLDLPFHPLSITLALLTSTRRNSASGSAYDVLHWAWGLGLPAGDFDLTKIEAEIDRTPYEKIDRIIWGWGGEPVRVWDRIREMLRQFGRFVGTTSEGRIIFPQAREADVEAFATAQTVELIPRTLQWIVARSQAVSILQGTVGQTPYRDGEPYQAAARANGVDPTVSQRAGLFAQIRETQLDFPNITSVGGAFSHATNQAVQLFLKSPTLVIKTNEGEFDIGDFVLLEDPGFVSRNRGSWFVDAAGEPIGDITGDVRFCGQIIGRTHNVVENSYTLTLSLQNYRSGTFPRWRAPSAEVRSAVGSGSATIDCINSAFGQNDALDFVDGDVVNVCEPSGVVRTGPLTVASVSGDTITFTTTTSDNVLAGDIIRLADVATYGINTNIFPVRAYAYIRGDATIDGDIWASLL